MQQQTDLSHPQTPAASQSKGLKAATAPTLGVTQLKAPTRGACLQNLMFGPSRKQPGRSIALTDLPKARQHRASLTRSAVSLLLAQLTLGGE